MTRNPSRQRNKSQISEADRKKYAAVIQNQKKFDPHRPKSNILQRLTESYRQSPQTSPKKEIEELLEKAVVEEEVDFFKRSLKKDEDINMDCYFIKNYRLHRVKREEIS